MKCSTRGVCIERLKWYCLRCEVQAVRLQLRGSGFKAGLPGLVSGVSGSRVWVWDFGLQVLGGMTSNKDEDAQ